jgi:hypothetical protein
MMNPSGTGRLPSLAQASITSPRSSDLEIAAGFDGFTAIDELCPGMTWDELLAATWGLPVAPVTVERSPKPTPLSIMAIVRHWFRVSSVV